MPHVQPVQAPCADLIDQLPHKTHGTPLSNIWHHSLKLCGTPWRTHGAVQVLQLLRDSPLAPSIFLLLNPDLELRELPLKAFYTYALPDIAAGGGLRRFRYSM
jgi:hypothetical protein